MMNEGKLKQHVIGYTTGVFDLFHIGHLNILRSAKALCDILIVGVTTDELMEVYKGKKAVLPFTERVEIVRSIKYVDAVVAQDNMNKLQAYEKLKFNVMFVGDDWYGKEKWKKIEEEMKEVSVKVIFLPYTKNVSSTVISKVLSLENKVLEE